MIELLLVDEELGGIGKRSIKAYPRRTIILNSSDCAMHYSTFLLSATLIATAQLCSADFTTSVKQTTADRDF